MKFPGAVVPIWVIGDHSIVQRIFRKASISQNRF
jgi:hypothetical protein